MDPNVAKPRVNGSMLSNHIGKYVCLVGKNLGVSWCFKGVEIISIVQVR